MGAVAETLNIAHHATVSPGDAEALDELIRIAVAEENQDALFQLIAIRESRAAAVFYMPWRDHISGRPHHELFVQFSALDESVGSERMPARRP